MQRPGSSAAERPAQAISPQPSDSPAPSSAGGSAAAIAVAASPQPAPAPAPAALAAPSQARKSPSTAPGRTAGSPAAPAVRHSLPSIHSLSAGPAPASAPPMPAASSHTRSPSNGPVPDIRLPSTAPSSDGTNPAGPAPASGRFGASELLQVPADVTITTWLTDTPHPGPQYPTLPSLTNSGSPKSASASTQQPQQQQQQQQSSTATRLPGLSSLSPPPPAHPLPSISPGPYRNPMSVSSILSGPTAARDRPLSAYSPSAKSASPPTLPSQSPAANTPQPPVLPPTSSTSAAPGTKLDSGAKPTLPGPASLAGYTRPVDTGANSTPSKNAIGSGRPSDKSPSLTAVDKTAQDASNSSATKSSYPPLPSAYARESPYSNAWSQPATKRDSPAYPSPITNKDKAAPNSSLLPNIGGYGRPPSAGTNGVGRPASASASTVQPPSYPSAPFSWAQQQQQQQLPPTQHQTHQMPHHLQSHSAQSQAAQTPTYHNTQQAAQSSSVKTPRTYSDYYHTPTNTSNSDKRKSEPFVLQNLAQQQNHPQQQQQQQSQPTPFAHLQKAPPPPAPAATQTQAQYPESSYMTNAYGVRVPLSNSGGMTHGWREPEQRAGPGPVQPAAAPAQSVTSHKRKRSEPIADAVLADTKAKAPKRPAVPLFGMSDVRKLAVRPALVRVKNDAVTKVVPAGAIDDNDDGETPRRTFLGRYVYDPFENPAKLLDGSMLRANVGGVVEVCISTAWLGCARRKGPSPDAPPPPPPSILFEVGDPALYDGEPMNNLDGDIDVAPHVPAHVWELDNVRKRKLWGTDVYTDDSDVLAMCLHSGWLRLGRRVADDGTRRRTMIAGEQGAGDEAVRRSRIPWRGFQDDDDDDDKVKRDDASLKTLVVRLVVAPKLVRYQGCERVGLKSRSWGNGHDGVSLMIEGIDVVEGAFQPHGRKFLKRLPLSARSCANEPVPIAALTHSTASDPPRKINVYVANNTGDASETKKNHSTLLSVSDTFVIGSKRADCRFVWPDQRHVAEADGNSRGSSEVATNDVYSDVGMDVD